MKKVFFWILISSILDLTFTKIHSICDGTGESEDHNVIGCVMFGEKYSGAQWSVCMKEQDLTGVSDDKTKCMNGKKDCWYPCEMAAFGKSHGRVSDLCKCYWNSHKKSDVESSCYLYKFGDCSWFERCLKSKLENVLKCDQNVIDYVINNGSKLCRANENLFQKTPIEQRRRLLDFQKCLQAPWMSILFEQNSDICTEFGNMYKMNSLKCFTSLAEEWICDLPNDWFGYSRYSAYHTLKSGFESVMGAGYNHEYNSHWFWDFRNIPCDISTRNSAVKRLLISITYTEDAEIALKTASTLAKYLSWKSKCISYDAQIYHKPPKKNIMFIEISMFQMDKFDAFETKCNTVPDLGNEREAVTNSLPGLKYVMKCTDGHEVCVKREGSTSESSDRSCHDLGGFCTSACPGIYSTTITCNNGRKCCFEKGEDTTCLAIGGDCLEDFQRCTHGSVIPAACTRNKHCCAPYYLEMHTAHCTNVPVISRQSWGARKSVHDRELGGNMPYFIMHNTAGNRCDGLSKCANQLVYYQKLHMTDNEWNDIGYTFMIDDGGNIYETTGWGTKSIHSHDFNARAYAVSFMGTFTSEVPTEKAIKSLELLAQCGVDNGWLANDYKYLGHRDVRPINLSNKDCPGFKFYVEMNKWDRFSHLAILPSWSNKDDKQCRDAKGLCYDIMVYPECINGTYHEKNDIKCTGHTQRKCCVLDN